MDDRQYYSRMDFSPSRPIIRARVIFFVLGGLLFTALWAFVPHGTLYWLLLPLIMGLVWMASYGWRQAIFVIHELIHRLENL
jgi:hypothetical protein